MKKIIILSALILFSSILFSQAWESLLPKHKKENGTLTMHDHQNAFNAYWKPYNVDADGYYLKGGEKTKAAGWKPFKRWEWMMQPRVNKQTGEFPKTSDHTEWKKYLQNFPDATENVTGSWTSMGLDHYDPNIEGNGIGQLGCVAFHPTDTNTFWVGAGFGGLWVTYDGGNNWQVLNDDLGVLGIADIAIPTDYDISQTLYIGTGSRDKESFGSLGVLKSTDGGQSWNQTELAFLPEDGEYVLRLVIHPNNNQILIAATTEGVFKSYNGGDTWSNAYTEWWISDLEFHPTSPDTIYGGAKRIGNIYRSTDGGVTWDIQDSTGGKRVEIAVSEDNPNVVYSIISGEGSGLKGIYKSYDSGDSFSEIIDGEIPGNNFLGRSCDGSVVNEGQGEFDLCIAVNPENADEVIIGGIFTWKSTNGGADWNLINSAYGPGCVDESYEHVHVDHHWLEFQPGSNTLFEVNDGGIYKSYDYEYNWINISDGLEIAQIYRIGVSQTVQDLIIAGTHHNGSKRLQNNIWWRVTGADGMGGLIDYTNSNIQYGSSQNGQLDRTMDNWGNRENISPGVGAWVTPYVLDPASPNILYVGTKKLVRSYDRGDNYDTIFNADSGSGDDDFLKAIAIAPSNTNVIYCCNNLNIWKTQSGGTSWQSIANNLPLDSCKIVSIAVKETDENTIWVTFGGYNEHGVYKSSDGGQNWTNISYGLPNVPVYSVVQNKLISGSEELYAGTSTGVFVKVNENTSWVLFNNQLPFGPVHEVEIYYNGSNSKIVAGTWGRGVWNSDLYSYETNADAIWTGIKSADWFDDDNWQYGLAPGLNNNVIIPALPASSPWPVINGGTATCNSLTIETGATLEVVHYLDVNGDFNVSGEIIMSGSNSDIDIVGNVNFEDGSTSDIQTSGATISLEGSWFFKELSNAQLTQGTVVFNGSSSKYIRNFSSNVWFNNITISKATGKYIYLSSSSTYNLIIKGDLFIPSNSSYRHSGTLNTVLEGTLYNYGQIRCYDGGFELAGSGTPIQSNGSSYFNNLIISNGTNSLNDNLEVRGDLIFNGGTLDCNSHSISIEGNWDNNSDLNAFIPGTGRVIFEGDDGQKITGSVNFNILENNISSGYIDVIDDVYCNSYDWTNGGMRIDHDHYSSFIAMDLADNAIYGDFILNYGNIELHSSGWVHLCGNLTINGGDFDVHGGTTNSQWPGFVDASLTMSGGVLDFKDMGINIKSSALSLNLDITGGEIKTIGSFYDYRGDFNPTGGEVTLYGQYNAYVDCISGSYFYDLKIDKESVKEKDKSPKSTSVSLWRDTEVTNTCVINEGEFDINGKTIYVDGLFSVNDGGTVVMIDPADTINTGYFWWNSGSMANITEGEIVLRNDWVYVNGTLAELSDYNRLILNGSNNQTIKVYEEDASFSSIRIEKTGGSVYTDADYPNDIYIKNNLHIISEALYFNEDNVDVEGSVYIGSGASLFINNGTTIEAGHNIILGTVEVSNSYVVVNQSFNLVNNSTLTINDTSSFILEKPFDGSFMNFGGTVELNGGFLEITHNGMEITATSNIIFNGGDLKVGGNFNVPGSGIFNPSQGSVEFIGSSDSWVNIVAGNHFHDLVLNKPNYGQMELLCELDIRNDLHIISGELRTDEYNVEAINITIDPLGILNSGGSSFTIKGNWANHAGDDGFIEDGSHVTFTDHYYQSNILTNEIFNQVVLHKGSSNGELILADNTNINFNQLELSTGKLITGNNNNVICDNDGYIASNASLIMPDASPSSTLLVAGEFSHDNNGFFEIGSGNDVAISQFIYDAQLTINGGNLDCTSSWWMGNGAITNLSGGSLVFSNSTPTWLNLNGTLTMTGGIIDAQLNSISFNQNFNGNLTGGTFTTGGSFKAEFDNIFQQNGGEVFFAGDSDPTLFLADGCYIHDFTFNRTGGTLLLLTDLNVANDFTINSGYFDTDGGTLYIGGSWANHAGSSAINLVTGSTFFNSDKPASILTDEEFHALFIDKSFADGNYLEVPANTTIQVNKHFYALDGMLRLNDNCELSVNVGFQLQDGAGIYAETATIRLKESWDNQNTTNSEFSGFYANTSTVIFDGNFDQEVNGASFEENFYNIIIDKPSGEFKPNANMSVSNDIVVDEGTWSYSNSGLYYDLYGNLTVHPNGSWQDDQNTLYFSSGDNVEFSNYSTIGSQFGDININLGEPTTNLQINADYSCTSLAVHKGILSMDNIEVSVSDWITIYDEAHMAIGNASILKMGNNSDITVSGGLLSFTGNETNVNLLTRESSGHYSFNISDNGSLEANYTTFEFVSVDGIHVHNTGLLTGTNPLQNCTFQNGETGGTLLNVENSQELVITESIFPTNTSGGLYNVSKSNNDGSLTFIDASGDFSGEGFESDIYNRVDWVESAIRLDVIFFLEGAFQTTGMSTDINGILPLSQPYNISPWNYTGTETVIAIPNGNIVDWTLIELRDAPDAASANQSTMVEQQAAFVLNDGSVVGLDGSTILSFNHSIFHSLFIVIKHRNHLSIMSADPLIQTGGIYSYNFTNSASQAFGSNQNNLGGYYGMIAGDADADGSINDNDTQSNWKNQVGKKGYMQGDMNLDTQVQNQDKNDWWLPNYGKTEILP